MEWRRSTRTSYRAGVEGPGLFYKSPLGQKLLSNEPRAIQFSMSYMNQWAQTFAETVNGQFRAEMRKRGKENLIREHDCGRGEYG